MDNKFTPNGDTYSDKLTDSPIALSDKFNHENFTWDDVIPLWDEVIEQWDYVGLTTNYVDKL